MKKWMVLVVLVLFILPSAQAGLGLFGTWWNSKDYDALYGGGLRLAAELGSGLGVEGRVSYLSTDLFEDADLTMDLIPLEAAVSWTLDLSEELKPYVGAGIGYYIKDVDWKANDLWDDATSKDSIGYFALAGLNLVLGNATLFGEAKYNLISEDDEFDWRGSDVEEQYSLDGLSINAGVKFGF